LEVQPGIVLRLDGKWWRKDGDIGAWRVFDSLSAAVEFAIAEVAKNPSVEFGIYNVLYTTSGRAAGKKFTPLPNRFAPAW